MGTILIDTPSRELVAAELIGMQLRSLRPEFELYVDSIDLYFSDFGTDLLRRSDRDKDFILTPSYNVTRTPIIAFRALRASVPIILYHSEQFYSECHFTEKLSLKQFKEFLQNVHLHLVWGEYFRQRLIRFGIPDNKIRVVGHIKNEIAACGDKIKESSKHYDFLFISSFSGDDYDDAGWQLYQQEYMLERDYDPRSSIRNNRQGMIEFIKRIAGAFPDRSILIRRHPGESSDNYSDLILKFDNISVSSLPPLSDDITNSDLVFIRDSTSVFEIERAGKPWISVDYCPTISQYVAEPREIFPLHSPSVVFEALQTGAIAKLIGSPLLRSKGCEYYVGPIDPPASFSIASALDVVMSGDYRPRRSMRQSMRNCIIWMKFFLTVFATSQRYRVFSRMLRPVLKILRNNRHKYMSEDHFFNTVDQAHAARRAEIIFHSYVVN